MSASWRDDDEECRAAGVKGGLRAKPRFSFTEVRVLLEAVKRNRYIILRKFNQGVSAETKKQTWTEITNQINSLGENHREVRQIMKKWADLKCDGKRRIAALRGPNGSNLRKKNLGPVERMVHKILMMSPRGDGDSDLELGEDDDFSVFYNKSALTNPPAYSYLSLTDNSHSLPGGASFDLSPLSSPEKELADAFHSSSDFDVDFADDGERNVDFDENDDSIFSSHLPHSSTALDPLPDDALMRVKPVHTYSRNNSQAQNQASSVASTSSVFPSVSDSPAAPPSKSSNMTVSSLPAPSSSSAPLPASSSSSASAAATDSTSQPVATSSSIPPPPGSYTTYTFTTSAPSSSVPSVNSHERPSSSSVVPPAPPTSGSDLSDPLPGGASHNRARDRVAQVASQSLQQQRTSRMLLTSVSQSLEILAQSVQLLVETQQEFVQESLLLQRETVDVLRDFSNTALTMLRDKANSGHLATHQHHHPPSHF